MRTQVQKWGNSLALRIPKALAGEAGLRLGSDVELALEGGRLVITAVSSWEARLEELVSRITEDNRHPETWTDPPVGEEFW